MHVTLVSCLSAAVAVTATSNDQLSAVSWDSDRLDVFGNGPDSSIWHKYWTPAGGFDPTDRFEDLSGPVEYSPATVSWGSGRLDLFGIDDEAIGVHKYWDGSNWSRFEALGSTDGLRALAATSWSSDRLDVMAWEATRKFTHQYWDGTRWLDEWEDMGDAKFQSPPSVTSWGKNRLDIFGINTNGTVLHQYWSGKGWLAEWEALPGPVQFVGTPVSSSMGEGRLDVWVAGIDGRLYHVFWAPGYYSNWEALGGNFSTAPQVIHWSDNRIDIVGQFVGETQYQYKYWDGYQWNPSYDTWYPKGGDFASQPALVSRGDQNLNIFGIDNNGTLKWQFWNDGKWLPSADSYYSLGDTSDPYAPPDDGDSESKRSGPTKDNTQVVFDRYKEDM